MSAWGVERHVAGLRLIPGTEADSPEPRGEI